MQPDVSVIIPTYNRRHLVEEAIQSCFAGNESLEIEVVVVDDGSTDGTREYLRSLTDERVRPVLQEHQGPQVARNQGLTEAQGRFVKFLDSDDLLVEGALTEEVSLLSRTSFDVAYGDLLHVDLRTGDEGWTARNEIDEELISGIFRGKVLTIPPVFLYRCEILTDAVWNPSIPYHQDTAFAINVASQCPKSCYVNCTVAIHRHHLADGRVSLDKQSAPTTERLYLQTRLIKKGVDRLRNRNQLSERHRHAAADGLWVWAHMLSVYDWDVFERVYEYIEEIMPEYRPMRSNNLLRMLDSLFGPRLTERIILPIRYINKYVVNN
jgi:glycosyltransferase involved in cell wall biosynthesis